MTVQIPPGFVQYSVEHWHDNYARPAVTTWATDLPPNTTDPVAIAGRFQNLYDQTLGMLIDSEVTIKGTRAVIGQDGGEPLVGIADLEGNGGATSRDSSPPALAVMLDARTNMGGRRHRGRKFLPWAVGDSDVNELGQLSPVYISAATTRCGEFLDALATNEMTLYVLHGAGRSGLPAPTEITSLKVNSIVRTQKQRQIR